MKTWYMSSVENRQLKFYLDKDNRLLRGIYLDKSQQCTRDTVRTMSNIKRYNNNIHEYVYINVTYFKIMIKSYLSLKKKKLYDDMIVRTKYCPL